MIKDIMAGLLIAGLCLVAYIITGSDLWAADMAQQSIDSATWYYVFIAYKFEIMVTIGSSLAGYIGGQHYKNHPKVVINNGFAIASFNGMISGVLSTWMLSNKYPLNEALQGGVLIAFCSPIIIWLLFLVMDKFFPGKADILKSGIYIETTTISDDEPPKTQLTKIVAAAVVGKRRNRRTRKDKEVWTDEQREYARNMTDSELDPHTEVMSQADIDKIKAWRDPDKTDPGDK